MPSSRWITRDLTRLGYSEACRELSDVARRRVPTSADEAARPASHVEEAAQLVSQAEEALTLAVVHERARGTQWEAIGESLGISREAAHERFAVRVRAVLDGVLLPLRSSGRGAGWWVCPEGLEDPDRTLRSLDEWVLRHREPGEMECGDTPVSAGLRSQDLTRTDAELAQLRALDAIGIVTSLAKRLTHGDLPDGVDERYARRVLLEHKLDAFSAIAARASGGSERDAISQHDEALAEVTNLDKEDLRARLTAERRSDDEVVLQLDRRPVAVLVRSNGAHDELVGWFVWLATPPFRGGDAERVDAATEAAIAAGLSYISEQIPSDELATPPLRGGDSELVGDVDAATEAAIAPGLSYISEHIAADLANGIGPFDPGGIAGAGDAGT